MTLEQALLEIQRLQTRLDHERQAREEAERIAEEGMRELSTRERQLRLLHGVTAAANAASSFESAVETVLEEICHHAGWHVGHAYVMADADEPLLISTRLWHVEGQDIFANLKAATQDMRFRAGEGLPGRTLASRQPQWVADVACDPTFLRHHGGELHVHGAFAFPVAGSGTVAAVFEFFSRDVRRVEPEETELAEQISLQLSRIFERQRAQAVLEEAAAAAAAGNRAKSEFLATMSHEIRTPMNGVIGFTNLLLETDLTPRQREYTTTIQRSGDALLTIINDILDFSKIEADRLELDETPFEPRTVAEEAAELLSQEAERKGVEIALEVEEAVPGVIVGDAGRVRQILFNLIGNAVKFTAQGHVLIQLRHLAPTGAWSERLHVAICDTGIGIPPEKQSQIFGKFTQVDASTTRKFGGTGLGLAITKGLVERMGGIVGVRSTPGTGSTFWFELPICRPADGVITVGRPDASLLGVRALVVDDLEVNRRVLEIQLRSWGMEVDVAESGYAALDRLRAAVANGTPYRVALLDFLMPEMDGESLARHIREDATIASTSMIMVTSGGQLGDESRFLAAGFSAYLIKPVARPRQLREAVMRALAGPLPAAVQAPAAGTGAVYTAAPATSRASASERPLRVLLAEDNPVNQRLAVLLLGKLHCSVDVAGDGREAVTMFEQLSYDCIFMDCQMPELDGYEATREIRRRERGSRRVPIVALTANAMADDRARCLSAGMDDYLSKPLKPGDLEEMLIRWTSPDQRDDDDVTARSVIASPRSTIANASRISASVIHSGGLVKK